MEGPPRITEEVVLDVLATTAGTSQGAPLDIEVQTGRSSQEDRMEEVVNETSCSEEVVHETSRSEEVVYETIETQDGGDHTLPEDEIPLGRSPPRTEKKDIHDLMTSIRRCWRVNIDMVEKIKTFAEEKEKECLQVKVGQENTESAFQTLKLKLFEVAKRFEESAVVMAEKTEEIRLLTQMNKKLQEILNRQSKQSHDLFEHNKMLLKEKEELEMAKEDLQKTSSNKDLQIQDLKEVERRSRIAVQGLEKNVETLMKAGKKQVLLLKPRLHQWW